MSKAFFDPKAMGSYLKKIMKQNNINRADLADKLGISPDTVYRYEVGTIPIKHDYLIEMCELFNVTPSYFYYGSDENHEKVHSKDIMRLLEGKSDDEIVWIYNMIKVALEKPSA